MIRKQLIDELKLTEEQLKESVILVKHPQHTDLLFMLLNKKANTFTKEFVREIHSKLDIVEENPGSTCLITTSLHPTIFSGGMDLNFMASAHEFDRLNFTLEYIRLLGRILGLSVPSIAMLNGHAIAGGCMLAFAHDWRVSRSEKDKVKMALNEIELSMHLPPGMAQVVQQKVSPQVFRDMVLTAKRFDCGEEGYKAGMVDHLAKEEDLLKKAIELGTSISKHGVNKFIHKLIKEETNKVAINACLNMQMAPGVRGEYSVPKPKL